MQDNAVVLLTRSGEESATIPAPRSGRFGNETPHPTLRRSVSKPTGDCSANYSHEAYITAIRRSDDINNIESEGRYCFAAVVMPRRTDAINSIESEGRYRVRSARSRQIADNRNICARPRIDATPSDKPFTTRGHSRCAVSSCRLIPHPVHTAPHGRQAIEPHSARSFHARHTVQAATIPTHRHTFNL